VCVVCSEGVVKMMSLAWIIKSRVIVIPLMFTFMLIGLITNLFQAASLPLWWIGQRRLYRRINTWIIYWFWCGKFQNSMCVPKDFLWCTLRSKCERSILVVDDTSKKISIPILRVSDTLVSSTFFENRKFRYLVTT